MAAGGGTTCLLREAGRVLHEPLRPDLIGRIVPSSGQGASLAMHAGNPVISYGEKPEQLEARGWPSSSAGVLL